jgi:hypothetical protein
LTNLKKSPIAIRVNPTPFTLRPGPALFTLPYRYVYAVLTLDTLFIHDTQQESAIAVVGGLHYSGLTDVSWGDDGNGGAVLCLSSSDGYVSVVCFAGGELGDVYNGGGKEEVGVDRDGVAVVEKVEVVVEKVEVVVEKVEVEAVSVDVAGLSEPMPVVGGLAGIAPGVIGGKKRIAPTFLRPL